MSNALPQPIPRVRYLERLSEALVAEANQLRINPFLALAAEGRDPGVRYCAERGAFGCASDCQRTVDRVRVRHEVKLVVQAQMQNAMRPTGVDRESITTR